MKKNRIGSKKLLNNIKQRHLPMYREAGDEAMNFWNDIIDTAMLGTGKKKTADIHLPDGLSDAAAIILADEKIDAEEQFLRTASVAFNYRQSGALPLHKQGIAITLAEGEERPYCSAESKRLLQDILDFESLPLTKYWLQHCDARQQIVAPEMVPELLTLAAKNKTIQTLAANCCGKRGAWLAGFNQEWIFSTNTNDEERWKTGTPEQRKVVLVQLRKTDKSLTRQWLQESWPQEDANTKTEFLKLLAASVDEGDIAFLESLEKEKSKKVKDEAIGLLKKIPGSSIVQLYWQALQQAVQIKTEKGLLGLTSKKVISIQWTENAVPELHKNGIEKLSNNKALDDNEFVVYQLLQQVPLTFWEQHWNMSAEDIIKLFEKEPQTKKYIPAFVLSVVNFSDAKWALSLTQFATTFYIELISLLPLQQQEYYSIKFFKGHEEKILSYALDWPSEWSLELCRILFTYMSSNPYQFSRSFYNLNIERIPVSIKSELPNFGLGNSSYAVQQWDSLSSYISKLLTFKQQVKQVF